MVNVDQVKRGTARYLDEEFTNKLTGWQKWVFGAGAGMYLENLGNTLERLRDNDLVKGLGIMDASGNIDAERLKRYFMAEARKGSITFNAPILGTVTLNENDVEKLYRYIISE